MSDERPSDPFEQRFENSAAIAVIGMGCMFPEAASLQQFWDNIQSGRDAIGPIPLSHWKPEDYFDADPKRPDHTYAQTGGFLQPYAFDPLKFGLAPHALEATDSTQLLGMVVAHEAMLDAGYGPDREFDRDRVSCILGVTGTLELVIPLGARLGHPLWRRALARAGVDEQMADAVVAEMAAAYVPWQENSFPGLLGNVVAGRIASRLDLGGTNSVVDAACASSLAAMHLAIMELNSGRADMVISGGMDTFNDIFMYMCFSKTPALSPTGHARPFDAEGDGTILGEGLGTVILKRLADAERDGDRIYAVIRGMGTASDGKGQAIYAPSARGQVKALDRAYREAGVSPRSIGLLEAHGTGTKVGDGVELEALKQVYQAESETAAWCSLGSVKSQIGHTKAAAGVAGMIKAVMALHHKVLPPTMKIKQPHPKLLGSPFVTSDAARPWVSGSEPRRAAVSAFGFGGSNFHCVLEEYSKHKTEISWEPALYLGLFSADDAQELQQKVQAARQELAQGHDPRVLCRRWRASFRPEQELRLALQARGTGALGERLDAALQVISTAKAQTGIFLRRGPASGRLAMIFAGQGSQATGMLRELACRFPEFLDALQQSEAYLQRVEGVSLQNLIYPPQAFNRETTEQQAQQLTETRYAQLALGTLGLATVRLLQRFHVRADMVGGHSFGELLAFYAAGVWSAEDFLEAAYQRGRLMSERALPGGGLLAVMAPQQQVMDWLASSGLELSPANENAPEQLVLGGAREVLLQAQQQLKALKISSRMLAVSTAFHTRFVADAVAPFAERLATLHYARPQLPLFSNEAGGRYADDAEALQRGLALQIAQPVRFVAMLQAMQSEGATTFAEIGPGRKLQGLLRANVGDEVLSLDGEGADALIGLSSFLLQLSVQGHAVDWSAWDPGSHELAADALRFRVMISGANYRAPQPARQAKSAEKSVVAAPQELAPSLEVPRLSPPQPPRAAVQIAEVPRAAAPQLSMPARVEAAERLSYASSAVQDVQQDKEVSMSQSPSKDLERLEKILNEMQDIQRRTTDAHTLFLENQRQFQSTIRDVLLPTVVSRQAQPSAAVSQPSEEPRRAAPAAEAQAPRAEPRRTGASMNPVSTEFARPVAEGLPPAHDDATFASFRSRTREASLSLEGPEMGSPRPLSREPSAYLAAPHGGQPPRSAPKAAGQVPSSPAPTQAPRAAAPAAGHPPRAASAVAGASAVAVPAEAAPSALGDEVLAIISASTGYPLDMLQAAMQLENDLGIDSIKKVEIYGQLQAKLPRLEADAAQMNDTRTIGDLIALCQQAAGEAPERMGAWAASTVALAVEPHGAAQAAEVLRIVADKTGFPSEMLEGPLDLESDLGIDSIKKVEIFSAVQERFPALASLGAEGMSQVRTIADLQALLVAPQVETLDEAPTLITSLQDDSRQDEAIYSIIAEKTGYPREVLAAEMDLEADLGIDSIKRVEILSALAEQVPALRDVSAETWSEVKTVGDFLAIGTSTSSQEERLTEVLLDPNLAADWDLSAKKKAQQPFQGPDLTQVLADLEADAGEQPEAALSCLRLEALPWHASDAVRRLHPDYEVWIGDDGSNLARNIMVKLQERGLQARLVSLAMQDRWPVPDKLGALYLIAPTKFDVPPLRWLQQAFHLLRKVGPTLQKNCSVSAVVTISRLGGKFGLDGLQNLQQSYTGGIAALAKTVAREWTGVHARALDLGKDFADGFAAALRAIEAGEKVGPVEIGVTREQYFSLELVPTVLESSAAWQPLVSGDLVLVTGGARGVTAATLMPLAAQYQPHFVIWGRTPLRAEEPASFHGVSDAASLKSLLLAQDPSLRHPRQLEQAYRQLVQEREIRQNIAALEQLGAQVSYHVVDVSKDNELRAAWTQLQKSHGVPVGIVHGAGVLRDRLLLEQKDEEFAEVLETKLRLLPLLEDMVKAGSRWVILFSSSTARVGRKGQVAYGVANEILNKAAQTLRMQGAHSLAINWGPWNGGMVQDGLKKLFAAEGIATIPLQAGAEMMQRLLEQKSNASEWIVWAAGTETQSAQPAASRTLKNLHVSIDLTPILVDHVLKHRAVVPAALLLEWMVAAAGHEVPELVLREIEQFRVWKGVTLDAGEDQELEVELTKLEAGGAGSTWLELILRSPGPRGKAHAQVRLGFASEPNAEESEPIALPPQDTRLENYAPYDEVLFHGDKLFVIENVLQSNEQELWTSVRLQGEPHEWALEGLNSSWTIHAPLLDAVFQSAIIWSSLQLGQRCLPSHLAELSLNLAVPKTELLTIHLQLLQREVHSLKFRASVYDASGRLVWEIAEFAAVMDSSLKQTFAQNSLPTSSSVDSSEEHGQ